MVGVLCMVGMCLRVVVVVVDGIVNRSVVSWHISGVGGTLIGLVVSWHGVGGGIDVGWHGVGVLYGKISSKYGGASMQLIFSDCLGL